MGTPFKMKGSPMQRNYGVAAPLKHTGNGPHIHTKKKKKEIEKKDPNWNEELNELANKRTNLKEKEEKRDAKRKSGKKVFLGNLKTKRNKKKQEKNQDEITKEYYRFNPR